MLSLQGQPMLATAAAMALLLACAFVLDAFELIFLVVPVVMPPLLAQVGDAAWVAVLALLVLQAGFLLPPFGYAVVLARGQQRPRAALGALAAALAPYLVWLGLVGLLVAVAPQTTRWLRTSPPTLESSHAPAADDVEQMIRNMSPGPSSPASAPGP
jgi:TRAP-type mannitol/chloroaromatic compound transport system permease large subunit